MAGFSERYLPNGEVLKAGAVLRNEPLADLLQHLSVAGLDDFYRGKIVDCIATASQASGVATDLFRSGQLSRSTDGPLSVTTSKGTFYNPPLPHRALRHC